MPAQPRLVHELVLHTALRLPEHIALRYQGQDQSYAALGQTLTAFAAGLQALGLQANDRVGLYCEKRFEYVAAMYGSNAAGGIYVPINPALKAEQASHILLDGGLRFLVTTADRLASLQAYLPNCPSVRHIIVLDGANSNWVATLSLSASLKPSPAIDQDVAAILYTSGSTGKPKGVVLSHRNIVAGAQSVVDYLHTTADDRLLAVLPLSFDYGMNQLTQAALVGATVVLINHLFAKDVITAVVKERITCLAGVPPLWLQLVGLDWPIEAQQSLRLITNSGGHFPRATLQTLRGKLPHTKPYLMYGLTEAFRSTYLPPEDIDSRPDSMGKAIPNAEILVVRPDGSLCDAGEAGELVHRGVHVALGYWNDPVKTAERYKPVPQALPGLVLTELAVWSGDTVTRDADGYLYYVGRLDEQIKVSGYRVSPGEVEEILYQHEGVLEAVAFGVKHPTLGAAIVAVVYSQTADAVAIKKTCQTRLPAWMQPSHIAVFNTALPRNPNGKIDRKALSQAHTHHFTESAA
jgi:acyl-CoA ligase (AMP-forming) (exosortase A-associated)